MTIKFCDGYFDEELR